MTSHTSLGRPNHYVQFKALFNFLEVSKIETQWQLREELNMTVDFSLHALIKYTSIAVISNMFKLFIESLRKAKERLKEDFLNIPRESLLLIKSQMNMSEPHLEIERQWS